MRREIILMLLGIICISTISSLLSEFKQINTDKVLLDTVVGAVGAGNFSYWQSGLPGTLLIELTSLTGDADLYVSNTVRPSYEVDKNNFSSVTCGHDLVSIPSDFPRPIRIGVFGHWSATLSEYKFQVFWDRSSLRQFSHQQLFQEEQAEKHDVDKKTKEKSPKKQEEEVKPRYLKLINLLDMIFEMFVL